MATVTRKPTKAEAAAAAAKIDAQRAAAKDAKAAAAQAAAAEAAKVARRNRRIYTTTAAWDAFHARTKMLLAAADAIVARLGRNEIDAARAKLLIGQVRDNVRCGSCLKLFVTHKPKLTCSCAHNVQAKAKAKAKTVPTASQLLQSIR